MPAYASDPSTLFCYTQDIEKAKELMAEAGLADGFSATVIAATGEPPVASAEAQVIQSQLAEIGIKLDIKMMELNVYVDAWLAGDFDMAVAQNGGRPDPYTMYNRYFTKDGNLLKVSNFVDDELDSLMQQGRVETDPPSARRSSRSSRRSSPRCRPGSGSRPPTATPRSRRPCTASSRRRPARCSR